MSPRLKKTLLNILGVAGALTAILVMVIVLGGLFGAFDHDNTNTPSAAANAQAIDSGLTPTISSNPQQQAFESCAKYGGSLVQLQLPSSTPASVSGDTLSVTESDLTAQETNPIKSTTNGVTSTYWPSWQASVVLSYKLTPGSTITHIVVISDRNTGLQPRIASGSTGQLTFNRGDFAGTDTTTDDKGNVTSTEISIFELDVCVTTPAHA